MLTIFTIPKPFEGHIDVIQRNALESWTRLPDAEVFLCGDEDGVAGAAAEFGARHIPAIARNEFGTPLVGPAFAAARQRATRPLLCYANADLILLGDLLEAARTVSARFPLFLIAGQRWNLAIKERLDFSAPDWEPRLRAEVARRGKKEPPWGSDYFVFPRDLDLRTFPDFAVGRPRWDNWVIYQARTLRIPTIDATGQAMVVHQLHGYGHVPSRAVERPRSADDRWEGPEADANRTIARADIGADVAAHLEDATHVLTASELRPARGRRHLLRRWRMRKLLPLRARVRGDLEAPRPPKAQPDTAAPTTRP
jgi:hypothetical protein